MSSLCRVYRHVNYHEKNFKSIDDRWNISRNVDYKVIFQVSNGKNGTIILGQSSTIVRFRFTVCQRGAVKRRI